MVSTKTPFQMYLHRVFSLVCFAEVGMKMIFCTWLTKAFESAKTRLDPDHVTTSPQCLFSHLHFGVLLRLCSLWSQVAREKRRYNDIWFLEVRDAEMNITNTDFCNKIFAASWMVWCSKWSLDWAALSFYPWLRHTEGIAVMIDQDSKCRRSQVSLFWDELSLLQFHSENHAELIMLGPQGQALWSMWLEVQAPVRGH